MKYEYLVFYLVLTAFTEIVTNKNEVNQVKLFYARFRTSLHLIENNEYK